jgi:hypothetical protein
MLGGQGRIIISLVLLYYGYMNQIIATALYYKLSAVFIKDLLTVLAF